MSCAQAAKKAGISYASCRAFDRGAESSSGHRVWLELCRGKAPFTHEVLQHANDVLPFNAHDAMREALNQSRGVGKPCSELAARALDDFEFFRYRYMGRRSTPWQVMAAEVIREKLESPDKEFVVMNCPPGAGKTTMLHDISAWMTARDRAIRGLNGSRTSQLAIRNTRRLRMTLERATPPRNATACLAQDYGLFKPEERGNLWRAEEFTVLQDDGTPVEEKEPTWSSYGMDSAILGNRGNLLLWDDTEDTKSTKSEQAREDQRVKWDDECETRLEPGGLLVLCGQRVSAADLSRYNLDKKVPISEVEIGGDIVVEEAPQYEHIVFKAHDETKCTGKHPLGMPAWPDSCLLDPKRLPWHGKGGLGAIKRNRAVKYHIQYQQEDVDPDDVLVQGQWVDGCWDDRGTWELPSAVRGVGAVSVDPSGVKYWAIQGWFYSPAGDDLTGGRRYLLDLINTPMGANQLLDWNPDEQKHYGVLEEWRKNYVAIGRPLKYVIVEVNAAQRYLLQFEHARRWAEIHGIQFIPHSTGTRKLDEELGVWGLIPSQWQFARVRLPGKARHVVQPLVEQVTSWPGGAREDQVMAEWFLEANLKRLALTLMVDDTPQWRPSWLSGLAGVA